MLDYLYQYIIHPQRTIQFFGHEFSFRRIGLVISLLALSSIYSFQGAVVLQFLFWFSFYGFSLLTFCGLADFVAQLFRYRSHYIALLHAVTLALLPLLLIPFLKQYAMLFPRLTSVLQLMILLLLGYSFFLQLMSVRKLYHARIVDTIMILFLPLFSLLSFLLISLSFLGLFISDSWMI